MPWCPKCRNEYKEGYTVCSDCGCELVEELEEEMSIAYFGTQEEIERILEFLNSNDINGAKSRYNEEDKQYELLIPDKDKDEVKTALRTYFKKILPELVNEEEQETVEEENQLENDNVYVKPSERATEYKSGAATLLLVGIAGGIALILADLGILNFPMYGSGKILINVVLGGMFVAFIVLGISSIKSYKMLSRKASEDENLEEKIVSWFMENITVEDIKASDNDGESEEACYFNRIAYIKTTVAENFPTAENSFIDYIAEKLYTQIFE